MAVIWSMQTAIYSISQSRWHSPTLVWYSEDVNRKKLKGRLSALSAHVCKKGVCVNLLDLKFINKLCPPPCSIFCQCPTQLAGLGQKQLLCSGISFFHILQSFCQKIKHNGQQSAAQLSLLFTWYVYSTVLFSNDVFTPLQISSEIRERARERERVQCRV
jgi:hypothetical protein